MSPEEILDLPMQDNDADAATIRDYLVNIVSKVWEEDEGFSGKRPFGNSGWWLELYITLIEHEVVDGTLDEDGYIEECDSIAAHGIISEAIEALR